MDSVFEGLAEPDLLDLDLETWFTTTNLHKGYHPENTADKEGRQKNHKNAADIHP
jgi:hypothetical protein